MGADTGRPPLPFASLTGSGLNRHALFDLSPLPAALRERLPLAPDSAFRQLLLVGHAGPSLWTAVTAKPRRSADPIDDHTIDSLITWFAAHLPGVPYRILYPGECRVGLQALGALAGWHHASPFKVGIDAHWGTWFAYRALVLMGGAFAPTFPDTSAHPCLACQDAPCLDACPAGAVHRERFDLSACLAERTAPAARCADACLSRLACPVGAAHRYPAAQIAHSYRHSLRMIARLGLDRPPSGQGQPAAYDAVGHPQAEQGDQGQGQQDADDRDDQQAIDH